MSIRGTFSCARRGFLSLDVPGRGRVYDPVQKPLVSLDARAVVLRDGTRALTRPVRPTDGAGLTHGLNRLSPEGRAYRFLHHRKRFTEQELHYLTHCDFVDHIGLVFMVLDNAGQEVDGVGVARCIRMREDPELAEVAIVFIDEWQRRGAGTVLLGHLADLAWQAGICRWQAFMLDGNTAAERLFEKFGACEKVARPGFGTREVTYRICERGNSLSAGNAC